MEITQRSSIMDSSSGQKEVDSSISANATILEDHTGFLYHQYPQRHPCFSGYYTHNYNGESQRQRPSKRWSTEMGIFNPPSGYRASALILGDKHSNNTDNDNDDPQFQTDSHSNVADHSAVVESYFASIRVPASFLAATSFAELFAVEVNPGDTSIQRHLQTFCLICQGLSFVLSMNVIMLSTQAVTRSLTGDFDPFAETGYEFLFREFHFEFVSVRWSFIVSLYGFLCAVTAKILYGFELLNSNSRSHLELGIGVCLLMGSLLMHVVGTLDGRS